MKNLHIFLLIFLLVHFSGAFATHIVGGDISCKRIGTSNDYEISLDFVKDCTDPFGQNADFDDDYTIFILDGQSLQQMQAISTYAASVQAIPINFSISPCYTLPNIRYEHKKLVFSANLPANPNGYWITYARCCRNWTVTNLYKPAETGFTLSTFIPATTIINSSPVFSIVNPNLVCVGDSLNLNLTATDVDGDSLVYRFSEAYIGASINSPISAMPMPADTAVSWLPNYNFQHPFGINAYTYFDSQTGILKALCNHIGQYVFAVVVEEYRNGVLLGKTRREMQLNVVNCQNTDTPPHFNFTQTSVAVGDTLYFYPGMTNVAHFSMYDFQGGSNTPEPLIFGEITGGVFDSTEFSNIATSSHLPFGASPLNGTISMSPSSADANKIAKSYVHIWRIDSCTNASTNSLLDSFYVRIMPCNNATLAPIISGLQVLNNDEIWITWQSFPAQPNFGYYILEKADADYTWQTLATFPNSSAWAYIDTAAHHNDSIPYCYRIGVASICDENNTVNYSADSCTFTLPSKTTLSCAPNPNIDGNVRLKMGDFQEKKVRVTITDIFGKRIWEKDYAEKVSGDIYIKLDETLFMQDVYYIQVVSEEEHPKTATTILVMQK